MIFFFWATAQQVDNAFLHKGMGRYVITCAVCVTDNLFLYESDSEFKFAVLLYLVS